MNKDQFAYLNETIVALESQLSQVQGELKNAKMEEASAWALASEKSQRELKEKLDKALAERDALKAENLRLQEKPSRGLYTPDKEVAYETRYAILQKEVQRLRGVLAGYGTHSTDCILSFWSAGEPTPYGGYRTMYKGKWYQTKPVDETPKCECGFDQALSSNEGHD